MKIAVLTVSDSRSEGGAVDVSGPTLVTAIRKTFEAEIEVDIVSDDQDAIVDKLKKLIEANNVVITTGGTGFAARDVTPEATRAVITRECRGLEVALHSNSLNKTPMAALSRGIAGISGRTLIVNFPGSPKAVVECWEVLSPILRHAVSQLTGDDDGSVHRQMQS